MLLLIRTMRSKGLEAQEHCLNCGSPLESGLLVQGHRRATLCPLPVTVQLTDKNLGAWLLLLFLFLVVWDLSSCAC
jgi:hypothetical protein